MITRRLSRPARSLLSSSQWSCASCVRTQTRRAHNLPTLSFHDSFTEYGVPGLFSADGYSLGWTQYQTTLVQKLNELTAGEPWENSDVKTLSLQFARDPMNASLFNHASMAVNNHFFYNTFSTAPTPLSKVPNLKASLESTFGSIENLQTTMLEQASAMFGPGFVWLVWARDMNTSPLSGPRKGTWRLLNTYLAGTPFPEAGYRQQSIDMATTNAGTYNSYLIQQPAYLAQKHQEQRERAEREAAQRKLDEQTSGISYSQQQQEPANHVGKFGPHSRYGQEQARLPPGGTSVMPVLCVNTWEHVWIYDFGLAGKRRFLKDWWDAIDWSAVEQNAPTEAKYRPAEFHRS